MTYADLLRFNPWWEKKEAIAIDTDISKFEAEPVKYFPHFELRKGICVLRGPRQVGKTTLFKLNIKTLLEKGIDPKSIFFYSFELKRKPEDIYGVLLEYLESIAPQERRFIFLDETTTIIEWPRALKLLVDRGDLKKEDTIMISGSSAIDLKKGAERLPGRGIEGNEFFYLPCSFRTYLKLRGIEVQSADPLKQSEFISSAKKNIDKLLTLNREFSNYLGHGGFLYAINHGVNELVLEKYARWLEGDFAKWGKSPLLVKEVLQGVIRKKCSQFSYHAIAKETSIATHNTVIEYLEMLGEELFLRTVNKTLFPLKVERKKEKKAFFTDPLLTRIAEHWAEEKLPEPCKVEQTVMNHASRLGSIYFYNDGKKEIDCVAKIGSKTLGIEVKWSDNIKASDTYAVRKTNAPYVLSRETLKKENGVPVIPVALFLAMLETPELIKRNVLRLE